ncbi:bifunctional DNA-formamidopyrimidine glycosylase/DNA-(apurinic or apyrimidinic site) lyase [Trueperella pecoris]|uniref:Formamidopyrimidine-DNA glycosylase n=1 Tax=Trueperella pecoris TaxID=2733571 RepID=A0A7M1QXX4_9ACTO|nr:bifunctional DNA-formamidopyrimidine glycosylase/DNA-(apurinic or apyrimidinic site) lyase [Trueperella pecoris]QOR46952.1 bifunctional DNA-formamidopyrimidine glycosylase/DNA-(apurinic or apyrimidinic site) lyase [Trueperella pecoris]
MPELPEVETIRLGLEPLVVGRSVVDVEVLNPRAVRRSADGLEPIIGSRIAAVARRGKYLWFDAGERALVAHLGMSGQFRVGGADNPHRRASLFLDDGLRLDFVDQRTFGHLMPDVLVPTADGAPGGWGSRAGLVPRSVAHIGRDPLDPAFDLDAVVRLVRKKRSEIKRVLLDQSVASGVGNIYADESLFLAGVHPRRQASGMSVEKIRSLYVATQDVMRQAVDVGGTSFDALYVNVNGASGYFDRSLNVYGRAGRACRKCGNTIRREPFMGRSSHFCPACQRGHRLVLQR